MKLRLGMGGATVFAGLFGVLLLPAAITLRLGDPIGGDCVEIGVLGPDDIWSRILLDLGIIFGGIGGAAAESSPSAEPEVTEPSVPLSLTSSLELLLCLSDCLFVVGKEYPNSLLWISVSGRGGMFGGTFMVKLKSLS